MSKVENMNRDEQSIEATQPAVKSAQLMDVKVRIHSIKPEGGLRARCSLELGGCFAVRGVKLMDGANGYFLSMPSYKVGENYKDICFAVTKDFRQRMLDAVVGEYEQSLVQANLQSQRQETGQQQTAPMGQPIPQQQVSSQQAVQTNMPGFNPSSPYFGQQM